MSPTLVLTLSIISTSFLGSWHCAAMCGPVATLMAQRKSLSAYHLGRFVSYATLGLIGGGVGQVFLNSQFVTLRWISAILMAGFLFYLALTKFLPQRFKQDHLAFTKIIDRIHGAFFFKRTQSGFGVGLLTAFLPCGWLYTYVLAAIATQSAWGGLLVMSLFWLGGLPVLLSAPTLIRSLISGSPRFHQKIAGFILLFSSVYSLASFMWMHH